MFYLKESLEIQLSRFCLWLLVRDFFATNHARCGQYYTGKTMYIHIVIKRSSSHFIGIKKRKETTFPEQVLVGDTFSNNPRLRQNKNHQNKFPNTPRAVCRRLLTTFYPISIFEQKCRISGGKLSFFNSSVFCSTSTKTT